MGLERLPHPLLLSGDKEVNSAPDIQRFTEAFFSPQVLFESITPEYRTVSYFRLAFDVFMVFIWLEDKRSPWLSAKLIRVCFTWFCNIDFSLRNPAPPHPADSLPLCRASYQGGGCTEPSLSTSLITGATRVHSPRLWDLQSYMILYLSADSWFCLGCLLRNHKGNTGLTMYYKQKTLTNM